MYAIMGQVKHLVFVCLICAGPSCRFVLNIYFVRPAAEGDARIPAADRMRRHHPSRSVFQKLLLVSSSLLPDHHPKNLTLLFPIFSAPSSVYHNRSDPCSKAGKQESGANLRRRCSFPLASSYIQYVGAGCLNVLYLTFIILCSHNRIL